MRCFLTKRSHHHVNKKRKKPAKLIWENKQSQPTIPPFIEPETEDFEPILEPEDYFRKFITDDILQLFAEQSNIYCLQTKGKTLGLTKNEFEQWLGLCLYMSISTIPLTRLYWSGLDDKVPSIMKRDRFEEIKANIHLVDNTTNVNNDKMFKVRPLIDHLRTEFQKLPKTEHLSIDEQLVPFKGKHSLKQYMPKKPKKWGYKIFVLSASMGLMYDLMPYTGAIKPVNKPNVPDLKPSANSVLHLAESIPDMKNHKLYFDNWFSNFELIRHLATRGIWCTGTVKANRLKDLTFMNDKELKAVGRGTFDEWSNKLDNITVNAVKWLDNKSVHLISSHNTTTPLDKVMRFEKKMKTRIEVQRPFIVKDYNENMGGVDIADQLISYYRMSFRSKKFYHRLIFHLFDVVIVNGWLLYRMAATKMQVPTRKQMSLCEFKLKISDALIHRGKSIIKKRGRPSSVETAYHQKKLKGHSTKKIPDRSIRLDKIGHYPAVQDPRLTCKLPGCKGQTNMTCLKCNVKLCCDKTKNCFLSFHTE